jgi:DNA recombination protein RmuC
MSPDQFGRNVEIVPGSNERVEYAIRLPGDGEALVWLPVDSKFPTEDYERLEDAPHRGNVAAEEIAGRAIESAIRLAAKDISTKYIHSPHSTDFAVMFLPTEGLFAGGRSASWTHGCAPAGVSSDGGGADQSRVAPGVLSSGFPCSPIQRRSGEVWTVLSAVKTEFGKFGGILDKVSKKLRETQEVAM